MSYLASAARKVWHVVSTRPETSGGNGDEGPGDANPTIARRSVATGGNPDSKFLEPSSPVQYSLVEMSAEATLPHGSPRTPPRVLGDPLFRKESPLSCSAASSARHTSCSDVSYGPTSPEPLRLSGVRSDRQQAGSRGLSLHSDCGSFEPKPQPLKRPHKIPFIFCSENGELRVHPAAAQELKRRESTRGIAVVSVFGKPKSGKSTLIERGFFGLGPEPEDPDHLPGLGSSSLGTEVEAIKTKDADDEYLDLQHAVLTGVDDSAARADEQASTGCCSTPRSNPKSSGSCHGSPASNKAGNGVILWLWSAPVTVHQHVAAKIDLLGGRSVSAASVSSFSSRASAEASVSAQSCHGRYEATILESGSSPCIDDSVVLALCVLLSSHLVYNGVDLLDAARIQMLTALRDLPKRINTRDDNGIEDGIAFPEHFPRLSWMLRDCDAQLIDERRHPISTSAYLERALKVRGFSDEAEHKNIIRKMIVSFFPEQDCHVLPTPAPIPGLPLGERFLRKLVTVREAIFSKVSVKDVRGSQVDGAMLLDLVQSYISDANAVMPLSIPKAYDVMSVSRCQLALQRALEQYHSRLDGFRTLLPVADAAVLRWHSDTRKHVHRILAQLAVTDVEELRAQLDCKLVALQKELVQLNEQASSRMATELLETLYTDCEKRVRSGEITSLDMYEVERNKVRREFEIRTADLSQYACRMTMLEFMEQRLMKFSQTLLKNASQLQRISSGSSNSSNRSTPSKPPLTPNRRSPNCSPASNVVVPRSPSFSKPMSPTTPPSAEEGKWVKREVLEYVKRKAKDDLAELERELMAVIVAMENQVNLEGDVCPADKDGTGRADVPEYPEDNTMGRNDELAARHSPAPFNPIRPRSLRAAAPTSCTLQAEGECHVQFSQEHMARVMDCPSPLSCSSADDLGDHLLASGGVLPVALEAALDAVAEEANQPWSAAVTAAVAAAQEQDGEAWQVAMEAALEVATARAVSSLKASSPTGQLLSRRSTELRQTSPKPAVGARDPANAQQSPPEPENVGPQEASAPACIPQGAVLGMCEIELKRDCVIEASIDNSMLSIVDKSIINHNDLSRDPLQYSPGESPYTERQEHPRRRQKLGAQSTPTRTTVGPAQHGSSWLLAMSGDPQFQTKEAGEAACRCVEAEIIRRCILDTSPLDARKFPRTPTADAKHDTAMEATVATRRVALEASLQDFELHAPQLCPAEGKIIENQQHVEGDENVVIEKRKRAATRSAAPPPVLPAVGGAVLEQKVLQFEHSGPALQQVKSSAEATAVGALQVQKGHTYTESDLEDLRIGSFHSPSESANHGGPGDFLMGRVTPSRTPILASKIAKEGAALPDALKSFGNTPPASPAAKVKRPSPTKSQPRAQHLGIDLASWIGGSLSSMGNAAFGAASSTQAVAASRTSAALLSSTTAPDGKQQHARSADSLGLASPMVPTLLPDEFVADAKADSYGGAAALPPLQGQLFLDGEELVIPDPALGLLHCPCDRKVSVRPPAHDAAFVDVCIDCGAVHQRDALQQ